MSRQMHKLAARTVATSKKPGMLGDGGGLYLQVSKGGTKSWIYRFMLRGRSRDMGLGGADVVSLSEARDLALQARKLVKAGTDPIETKNTQQRQDALKAATTLTFAECAEAYIKTHEAGWRSAKHREQWRNTLDAYASSVFGDLPVDAIDTGLVMLAIEPIWTTKTETASRLRGRIAAVLDWANALFGAPLYDVAWMDLYSPELDLRAQFKEHFRKEVVQVNYYEQRLMAYQCHISLESQMFCAMMNRPADYRWICNRTNYLLERG